MDLPPELRAAIVNHDELNNTDQVVMALTCKENNEVMQLKRISIHIPQHDHMYGCPVHMRGGVDFIVNCVVIMVSALKCATARGAPCEHLDGVGVANSGCVKKCDRGIPFDAFKALAMSSQANLLETVSYICMNNHEVAMNAEQIQFVIDHLPSLRCLDIPGGVQVEVSRDKAASPVLWDPRVQFDHVNLDINSQLIEQLPALPATVKGLKFSYFEPWRRYNSNPVAKLTATGLLSGIHSLTFNWQDENSMVSIIGAIPSVSIQKKAVLYDKDEDAHYDTASAFIKSMRGSDPDAAIYWMAKMLYAGEDPRFIARRICIAAAEDVGNADPLALVLANAALQISEFVGLPEARIPLAQAAIYVACAPKSNASYLAIDKAYSDIETEKTQAVPDHLKDASYEGAEALGHGKGYKYAHDFPEHYVKQKYTGKAVKYYVPTDIGHEAKIKERLEKLRARKS